MRSPLLKILLKKFAIKKRDYLLTLLDLSCYILDNGSGDKSFKIATTPILRLYLIQRRKSSLLP